MSSAVWVIVSIPTVEREKQLREASRQDVVDESSVGSQSDSAHTPGRDTPRTTVPLKKIIEDAFEELAITEVVWYLTKNGKGYQIYFPVDLENSDAILEFFCSKRIGTQKETFIGMIPFTLFYRDEDYPDVFDDPSDGEAEEKGETNQKLFNFRSIQEKFLKSITARLTVAQVVSSVQSGAELTFDFLMYVVLAAWIAAMGLLDNSVVNTVASMLVSPLMGPVMAMTFGTIVRNNNLRDMGIRNAVIGFLLCIIFGYSFGLIVLNFTQEWNPNTVWPTGEMQARGQARVLWIGLLVALPSGAAVAVSLLSGNQASLVGVAISASLLPPCVNAGLLWAFATLKGFKSVSEDRVLIEFPDGGWKEMKPALMPPEGYVVNYNDNMAIELFFMGLVSLGLTTVNVVSIFIMAYLVLKIKEVAPMSSLSSATSRFWKEDVKIARDHQAKSHQDSTDTLGEEFLREWAAMMGLNEKQLLGDAPQAKAAQLQTLRDMIKDVESDDVFRTIVRSTQAPRTSLHPDAAFDFEQNVMNMSALPRRASHTGEALRRASKQLQGRRTSMLFVNPLSEVGETPGEYRQRRRSSALLRKSLLTNDHLPFSVWPQARPRSDSRFQVVPVSGAESSNIPQQPVSFPPRGRFSISRRPPSRLPSTEESEFRFE